MRHEASKRALLQRFGLPLFQKVDHRANSSATNNCSPGDPQSHLDHSFDLVCRRLLEKTNGQSVLPHFGAGMRGRHRALIRKRPAGSLSPLQLSLADCAVTPRRKPIDLAARKIRAGHRTCATACRGSGDEECSLERRAQVCLLSSVGGAGIMWAFLRSRRGVGLTALLLLLVLDAARSAVGHLGYLAPVSVWRPDPQAYADMTWPPATNVPAGATPAQRLYVENCAFCHGPDGRGNGASAPSMIPRPRDFTQGLFKYKSTPESAPPSDDDVIAVVTNGLNASGMPYFRGTLSEQEIRDVVGVVKEFSKAFRAAPTAPITLGPRPKSTPESLARGADIYKANCAPCHGDDLRGGQWLKDSKGYAVVSRDLTAPWTFRGGDAPQQIFLRLSTGLAPAPMPAYVSLSGREPLGARRLPGVQAPHAALGARRQASMGRANPRILKRADAISS